MTARLPGNVGLCSVRDCCKKAASIAGEIFIRVAGPLLGVPITNNVIQNGQGSQSEKQRLLTGIVIKNEKMDHRLSRQTEKKGSFNAWALLIYDSTQASSS